MNLNDKLNDVIKELQTKSWELWEIENEETWRAVLVYRDLIEAKIVLWNIINEVKEKYYILTTEEANELWVESAQRNLDL